MGFKKKSNSILTFAQFFELKKFEEMADYLDALNIPCPHPHKEGFNWRRSCNVYMDTGVGISQFAYIMISTYHSFINIPFKLELITEMFKGWRIIVTNVNKKVYKNEDYSIIQFSNDMEMTIWNAKYTVWTMKPPRTMDEFILNCQQLGIKLEISK